MLSFQCCTDDFRYGCIQLNFTMVYAGGTHEIKLHTIQLYLVIWIYVHMFNRCYMNMCSYEHMLMFTYDCIQFNLTMVYRSFSIRLKSFVLYSSKVFELIEKFEYRKISIRWKIFNVLNGTDVRCLLAVLQLVAVYKSVNM